MRGVDFGLGIGYNPEGNSSSSHSVQSRPAAVNSLRTGMMAQFKSSFVAASSNSQNSGVNSSSSMYTNKRPALSGFVSGGTIGGDTNRSQTTSLSSTPISGVKPSGQASGVNSSQRSSERYCAFVLDKT